MLIYTLSSVDDKCAVPNPIDRRRTRHDDVSKLSSTKLRVLISFLSDRNNKTKSLRLNGLDRVMGEEKETFALLKLYPTFM